MIPLGAEGELGYPLKKCKELDATQNSSLSFCTEPVKGFNFENNESFQKSNSHTGSHKGNWTFLFSFYFMSLVFFVFWFSQKTCKLQSGHSEKPHFEASVLVFGHQHVYCQNFIWMISLANKLLNS